MIVLTDKIFHWEGRMRHVGRLVRVERLESGLYEGTYELDNADYLYVIGKLPEPFDAAVVERIVPPNSVIENL